MSTEINTRGAIRSKMPSFPAPTSGHENECLTKSEIIVGAFTVYGNYGQNEYPLLDDVGFTIGNGTHNLHICIHFGSPSIPDIEMDVSGKVTSSGGDTLLGFVINTSEFAYESYPGEMYTGSLRMVASYYIETNETVLLSFTFPGFNNPASLLSPISFSNGSFTLSLGGSNINMITITSTFIR